MKNLSISRGLSIIFNLFILIIWLALLPAYSQRFATDASYELCFTPAVSCAKKIIKQLAAAQESILVQAYSFTDLEIAQALVAAHQRGVKVQIILDKHQLKERYTVIKFLRQKQLFPLISQLHSLAHNKVIIIDRHTVITGSYNYTKAAKRNAENLLIIHDRQLAMQYRQNWYIQAANSKLILSHKQLPVDEKGFEKWLELIYSFKRMIQENLSL